MKIFVIIAVHNRKFHTLQCLQLLKNQTYTDFGVVLVDDGSTDGTQEEVKRYHPEIDILKGDGSWWWTKSMNKGFERAIELGADIVITLNNDVVFNGKLIENLINLHHQYPTAIIGALNLIKKEKEYIFFAGLKDIKWWKAKEIKYYEAFTPVDEKLTGLYPTKCLNGRGTLVPVSIFKDINGYDAENFPQYASDYDLTLRAREKGYECLISYDIAVFSYVEETGKGKSFIKQSWRDFFKSFKNPYSTTSLKMWRKYYCNHAPKGFKTLGFIIQVARTILAFARKRNILNRIE
jgi:GT2 family glycosyltransferase